MENVILATYTPYIKTMENNRIGQNKFPPNWTIQIKGIFEYVPICCCFEYHCTFMNLHLNVL